jgi:hypothetical protein
MKRTVLFALLIVLTIAPMAIAQPAAPIVPNPAAPSTGAPPAAGPTTTPAPAPEWKVTSLSPAIIVSDAKKDIAKGVRLSGVKLDKLDFSNVKLTNEDGNDLTYSIADDSDPNKVFCLSVEVGANTSGVYKMIVDGTETKLTLTIKDVETVQREKVAAQAAAGAGAAVKVKGLEAQISALKSEITALKTADVALGTRINSAQDTATNAVKTATTALTTATNAAEKATNAQKAAESAQWLANQALDGLAAHASKKGFFGGRHDGDLMELLEARVKK